MPFMQAYAVYSNKRTSVCCANWIALSVEGVYCMTELFFFWKQLMNEVRVKIILISSSRWWRFLADSICYCEGAPSLNVAIQMPNTYIQQTKKQRNVVTLPSIKCAVSIICPLIKWDKIWSRNYLYGAFRLHSCASVNICQCKSCTRTLRVANYLCG